MSKKTYSMQLVERKMKKFRKVFCGLSTEYDGQPYTIVRIQGRTARGQWIALKCHWNDRYQKSNVINNDYIISSSRQQQRDTIKDLKEYFQQIELERAARQIFLLRSKDEGELLDTILPEESFDFSCNYVLIQTQMIIKVTDVEGFIHDRDAFGLLEVS